MATLVGRKPKVAVAWIALAFGLLFGSIFLGVGLVVRANITPYEGGVTTEGVVVDAVEERDSDGDRTFSAVVEFQHAETGETFTAVGSVSSSSAPTIGDTRTVSYLVDSPSGARVIEHQWFPWIFIVIGAGVLSLVAVGLLRAGLRQVLSLRGIPRNGELGSPASEVDASGPRDSLSGSSDDVYQPFGQDDDSIQDESIQDGPITGGPLE